MWYLYGTYPVVVRFAYFDLYSSYPAVAPFVQFNGSLPPHNSLIVRYPYVICAVNVHFLRCFVCYMSVSYPTSWYTNGRPPDMNRHEPHEYQTSKGQTLKKTRIGNGQWVDSPQRVIRWLSVHNVEHAQNSPKHTPTSTDIDVHVTDKTDMDRWILDDQRITIYGIRYSLIPSIR